MTKVLNEIGQIVSLVGMALNAYINNLQGIVLCGFLYLGFKLEK